MNSNYQVNRFYAQERVNAQLKAAEVYRRNHTARAGHGVAISAAATRAYGWAGRVSRPRANSLEALGQARVALFHR